jgi:hypothetical protein
VQSFEFATAQDVIDLARQRGADVLIDVGDDAVALENFELSELRDANIIV